MVYILDSALQLLVRHPLVSCQHWIARGTSCGWGTRPPLQTLLVKISEKTRKVSELMEIVGKINRVDMVSKCKSL